MTLCYCGRLMHPTSKMCIQCHRLFWAGHDYNSDYYEYFPRTPEAEAAAMELARFFQEKVVIYGR